MSASASLRQFAAAVRVLLVLTAICGVAYPLAVTAVAQVISPGTANGSRVEVGGKTVGSRLIAQPFDGPGWFQPRPSGAGEDGYDTLASAPSNLGPNNDDLVAAIKERRAAYAEANGVPVSEVPADAVTASGSGLDPHISPENARLQVARVARERDLAPERVRALVDDATQGRTLGVLGEARVNVLELNARLIETK
ncbi:MAG: potassium-transporting ATPase subunit KdpC [Solirubrobacteraceae bacterium]|nr:potassium-transporting ATPase subunit KdpC [Solirubrobacteraceae bacterium]